MASLALAFDILARDQASPVFKKVGDSAEKAGKQGHNAGSLISSGMKLAAGALLGGGLIAGFKMLYDQAAESARVGRLTNAVLKSTGGVAGVTAKQVSDLANAIASKTGIDDEAIQSGENLLLTFTRVRNEAGKGNDVFNQATAIITDMSVALGQDMKSSAIQVGKALNDPIKGVTALQRVGVSFTASQKDQIRTLVESGRVLDAQKIILRELSTEFGGAAAAAATPFDKLRVTLGNLAEEAGTALIPVVNDLANFLMDDLIPVARDLGPAFGAAFDVLKLTASVAGTVLHFFSGLPAPLKAAAIAFAAIALLRGPLDGLFTSFSVKVTSLATGMGMAAKNAGGFRGAISGLAGSISPMSVALGAATFAITAFVQEVMDVQAQLDGAAKAGDAFRTSLAEQKGQLNATSGQAARAAVEAAGLTDAFDKMGVAGTTVSKALAGNADAYNTALAAAERYDREQGIIRNVVNPVGQALDWLTGRASANADAFREMAGTTDGFLLHARLIGSLPPALEAWAKGTADAGSAAEATTGQVDEATKAVEQWRQQLAGINDSFVQPLEIYKGLLADKTAAEQAAAQKTADSTKSGKDSWRDFAGSVSISLGELATQLEKQITNQENWRKNLVIVAQRAGLGVAQALAQMGADGVELTAKMATGTDAEVQRMGSLITRDTALGAASATAALDAHLKIMAAVAASGGKATADAISRQLGIGVNDVLRIAAQYGINLARGINPLLGALGRPNVRLSGLQGFNTGGGFWSGGYTGDGGKYEPKGIVHGGEFVLTKEQTAKAGVGQLEVFAKMLSGYAGGGFVSTSAVPRPSSTAPYRMPISTAGDSAMGKEYAETIAWMNANWARLHPPSVVSGASGGSANGLLPIMAAARQYVIDTYGISNIGGYSYRNIAGTNVLSDHALGKAIDVMTTNLALGWRIANDFAFGGAHSRFRTENVIWQQSISSNGGGFVGMADRGSPTQNHRDHVHIDTYDRGGWLEPGYTLALNNTGGRERVSPPGEGGGTMVGTLYLDSGELLGKFRGVIRENERQGEITHRRRTSRNVP